ncbi:MAG: DUF3795 domain-containing protein [Candidatus Bathyarchaeota archaeon]|nr:DUF3795 domain-containing protein [Candidatus Bathyarchaeum tardum]WGM89820.1 MAG: DUF3795 domain-containing protein [Candidatus Bathyarchaeum tardum]WNZ30082.1 MAG: DUF3795 domain-containing protein [Candidatus Bathyarchaeota archaeon]
MNFEYPKLGICGLSCRLCPMYHTEGKSKCGGCKSEFRIAAGCPFITCAIKKKQIEFCWNCNEHTTCEKWKKHREIGKKYDSFKCYQKLEANIVFIQKNGVIKFEKLQQSREKLLEEMLKLFNEGRSKRYYCIVATVFEIEDLQKLLNKATEKSKGLDLKEKSKLLHSLLDSTAQKKGYLLKLRK